MTSYATDITPHAAPPRNRTGPVLALAGGSVAALVSLILIAAAGALLWVGHHKADDDGFYTSSSHTYSTPTRALTSDNLDVNGVPNWLTGSGRAGRIRIDPQGAGAFVGVAKTSDVNTYLDGVAHDQVNDLDFDPFKLDTTRLAGEGRPAMPAAQPFWVASSTGGKTLEWKVRDGDWTIVMMNADGSPDVSVAAKVGAKVPLIGRLGWGLAIPGALLGLAAVGLIAVGARGIARSREA
jgi:hypothetical protein